MDLGKYNILKGWDEVTLQKWSDYARIANENNGKVDIITLVEIFSDIPREVILQMPEDMFTSVVEKHLSWLNDEKTINDKPRQNISIDGEDYIINIAEKLKVKEYLDIQTIIESDKFNYPVMMAILCRKPNEVYDDDFIAETLPQRIEMFSNLTMDKALGLITFFLSSHLQLQMDTQSSLILKDLLSEATELVENIKSLQKHTVFTIASRVRLNMISRKLRKLKKCI